MDNSQESSSSENASTSTVIAILKPENSNGLAKTKTAPKLTRGTMLKKRVNHMMGRGKSLQPEVEHGDREKDKAFVLSKDKEKDKEKPEKSSLAPNPTKLKNALTATFRFKTTGPNLRRNMSRSTGALDNFFQIKQKSPIFERHLHKLTTVSIDDIKTSKNRKVPVIAACLVKYLKEYGPNTEGIFRKAGNEKKVNLVKKELEEVHMGKDKDRKFKAGELLERYEIILNKYTNSNDPDERIDASVVAALLKRFLGNLPRSVISPEETFNKFKAYAEKNMHLLPAQSNHSDFGQGQGLQGPHSLHIRRPSNQNSISFTNLYELKTLIRKLNLQHRDLLDYILELLVEITSSEKLNKMNAKNLAVCTAPTLFFRVDLDKSNGLEDMHDEIELNRNKNGLIQTMIENYDFLFDFSLSNARNREISRAHNEKVNSFGKADSKEKPANKNSHVVASTKLTVKPTNHTTNISRVDSTRLKLSEIEKSIQDLENRMKQNRAKLSRPFVIENMLISEVLSEKDEMQRLLLDFEQKFGKNRDRNEESEKNLVRPIYNRYKDLKQVVNENSKLLKQKGGAERLELNTTEIDDHDHDDPDDKVTPRVSTDAISHKEVRRGTFTEDKNRLSVNVKENTSNTTEDKTLSGARSVDALNILR